MEEIREFLITAKQNTYANASVEKLAPSRVGSSDYGYDDGNMVYHDTYFGGTRFIGEEVVYKTGSDQPIWGMNYYGVTLDSDLSEEAMDKALRPALMKVGEDKDIIPVRGPKSYVNGEYRYEFVVEGDLERFNGIESVYKNDQKVYELRCTGGRII